jgi:hypothetical protein
MNTEIRKFFGLLQGGPLADQAPDDSTVFKARLKLSPTAFAAMNDKACDFFYAEGQPHLWRQMRLLAVDGSTARLPHWPDILKGFPQEDSFVLGESTPLARVSVLYDCLNDLSLSAVISPMHEGEQTLLVDHRSRIRANDLMLLDRGYAAFWIFRWLRSLDAHFCVRMPVSLWECAWKFALSGKREAIVELTPSGEARRTCGMINLSTNPLKVRLIRVELDTGEVEVLCTSLLNSEAFPAEEFCELYHCRWGVEESLKRAKWRTEIENFSGKTEITVCQDFHARVFSMNLAVILAHPSEASIQKEYAEVKYAQKVNWASGISAFKELMPKLFFGVVDRAIKLLSDWFVANVSPVRPGRRYQRNNRREKRRFYINYKLCI